MIVKRSKFNGHLDDVIPVANLNELFDISKTYAIDLVTKPLATTQDTVLDRIYPWPKTDLPGDENTGPTMVVKNAKFWELAKQRNPKYWEMNCPPKYRKEKEPVE